MNIAFSLYVYFDGLPIVFAYTYAPQPHFMEKEVAAGKK